MKMWRKRDEWVTYAACAGDGRFTADALNGNDAQQVREICAGCRVRPECIQWALDERVSAVVVAGTLLPDPKHKRALRRIYAELRHRLPFELEARGEDI